MNCSRERAFTHSFYCSTLGQGAAATTLKKRPTKTGPSRPKKTKVRPEKSPGETLGETHDSSTMPDESPGEILAPASREPVGHLQSDEPEDWQIAVQAADSRKALDIRVLDLRDVTSFTDYFIICTASNPRQGQAIADEIHKELRKTGGHPVSVEGYERGEWVLVDYGDFVVHVFSETARKFYDLERLWRHAKTVEWPATAA
jgi:ribosome-associated protein